MAVGKFCRLRGLTWVELLILEHPVLLRRENENKEKVGGAGQDMLIL